MNLRGRDFISLKDFTKLELEGLIDLAARMKAGKDREQYLHNKYLGMLFTVASTRTRISFQVGARQLGAHAEYYSSADLQLSNNESLQDTASVMSRFLDAIIIRTYDMNAYGKGHNDILTMARYADVPVINALDDKDHPCQVMADLLTLTEKFGRAYRKKKIVMAWGYTKRQKSLGVPHSLMSAGALLGMDLRFAYPKGYELGEEYVAFAESAVRDSGGTLEFSNDLNEASEGADVIYVKNWKSLSMSREEDAAHRDGIQDQWRISRQHFERANPGAHYMDCMPFIRGEQVTAEVADGEHSIIYDQAENRLHMQKAIMASLI
ncbi:MAG TPA: ornithine carbamoyltransferase [Pyrinomonadaceae bacterium]|nr:ornithine carbamoyltransferase [Pyrinomonadaceae bacterium]